LLVLVTGLVLVLTGWHLVTAWPADPGACGGRKARRGGRYEGFIPDPIHGRDFALDGEAAAAVAQATRALQYLDHSPPRVAALGALARSLLR
jgi:hypothetical protein